MTKANINWNVKQIAKMVKKGTLKFDNAVQRGYVWDKKRQTLLIDTILRGYPIPPMYTIKTEPILNEQGKEICTYDCLDGKQRCTTLSMFVNDGFALGKMDLVAFENGDETDISGMVFSELDEEFQDRILSYSLTIYYFTEIDEDEISEMMARLNNGKSLTSYELSRVKAKDLEGIQELANHHIFDEVSNKGYACEDIVVKSYAMLNCLDPCLDTKCIRPLIEEMEIDNENKEQLEQIFTFIDDTRDIILKDDSDIRLNKSIGNKILKKVHLISLVPIAWRAINENIETGEFAEFLQEFYAGSPSMDDDYNAACQNGMNHAPNVKARGDALNKQYDRIFK